LPTFSFSQVGVKAIEFQAMPGPEARALRAKTMKARLVSWIGRAAQMRNVECGMQNEKKKNSGFCSEFQNPHSEFALPERPAPFCGS
jgi:hypothetical protein